MLTSMAYLYFMCMITAGLTISALVSDIGILPINMAFTDVSGRH